MSDDQNNNYTSTDSFVEEYQKKIKKLQYISKLDFASPVSEEFIPDASSVKSREGGDVNSHFSVMKNDFQQSFNRLENQFIAQFSEYKELKQSVEDAKKELDLAGKIKLTYESYHKIVQQCKEKRADLEKQLTEQARNLTIQKDLFEKEQEQEFQIKIKEYDRLKEDKLLFINKQRIHFEQSQMEQVESFQFLMFEDMQVLELQKDKIRNDHASLKQSLKLDFLKEKEEHDRSVQNLTSCLHEQMQCVEFEQKQLYSSYEEEVHRLTCQFELEKKASMHSLMEFSEQLEKKKLLWEKEKVSVSEDIDSMLFSFEVKKKKILEDLSKQKEKLDLDVKSFHFRRDKELKRLDEKEAEVDKLNNQKKREAELSYLKYEQKCATLVDTLGRRREELEILDQVAFEKAQLHLFHMTQMKGSLNDEKESMEHRLQSEYDQKRKAFFDQLTLMEEEKKMEFSNKTKQFEEQLDTRRRVFEEELLNRRQQIVDQCKKEQKVEFEQLLQFEKDKFNSQMSTYIDKISSYESEIGDKQHDFLDREKDLKEQIKKLNEENKVLQSELEDVEVQTRQSTISQFEDKYKKMLGNYKSRSHLDLQNSRQYGIQLENKLKQRELEVRDSQLRIKRLESQLNQYLLSSDMPSKQVKRKVGAKIVRNSFNQKGFQ
ncbi:hypothetical protein DID78_03715 [Candidatus Marinamargulisbacteria bacterium SCGC AG-343-D04]|nr:hypothetical protein DID78_03715 [Candidatus Marinamargulisbacteria bacterium SCGC AG-343-D04]